MRTVLGSWTFFLASWTLAVTFGALGPRAMAVELEDDSDDASGLQLVTPDGWPNMTAAVMLDGVLVKERKDVPDAWLEDLEDCGLEFVDGHGFVRPQNPQECGVEIVDGQLVPKQGFQFKDGRIRRTARG